MSQALRLDRAEFRILGNDALLAIAAAAPETAEALGAIKGVGKDTAERRGRNLLAAVKRGLKVPEKDLPRVPRPPRRPREPEIESRTGRLKVTRTEVAARLGLDPGVICPNSVLDGIARANPTDLAGLRQIEGLREWQVKEFGKSLLAAIKTP